MEFEKLVTLALENLKENSVYQLLQSDMDFQQESNAEGCAEQSYIRLDLTEEQRQICNPYVCWYCKGGDNYYWGCYCNELSAARESLSERYNKECCMPYGGFCKGES